MWEEKRVMSLSANFDRQIPVQMGFSFFAKGKIRSKLLPSGEWFSQKLWMVDHPTKRLFVSLHITNLD